MARKIKFTRPELKRQRERLARFRRYLPLLEMKQQLLQIAVRDTDRAIQRRNEEFAKSWAQFLAYSRVLGRPAGVDLRALVEVRKVVTASENIAGVRVPVFDHVEFTPADYSLFATRFWVDRAVQDLRSLKSLRAELSVQGERRRLLARELARTLQRVNLFERVAIPQALEALRLIRIHLGDELAAAIGRAKIAKHKLAEGLE